MQVKPSFEKGSRSFATGSRGEEGKAALPTMLANLLFHLGLMISLNERRRPPAKRKRERFHSKRKQAFRLGH